MPNNVTNKIIVFCTEYEKNKIHEEIFNNKCIDFEKLIPVPLHIYQQDISNCDEEDFKGNTGINWKRENWFTKWNAYDGNCYFNADKNEFIIIFDTAWSIPYPIIIAFANKYKLDFILKYFDEGYNFWGIEEWKNQKRIKKDFNNKNNFKELCIELKNFNPENND